MGNSSSCARPRASAMEEWNCKEAGAAAAATTLPSDSTASCASSFEKTVLLHDWWLIKVKDDSSRPRLAVGGMATTGKAVRIFKSAPIVKRYDGYTLETVDGITVRIQGLINTSRMHQNGFPTEACNHFRIGFPYSWKDYADRYFRTDTESNGGSTCASDIHKCSMDSGSTANNYFPLCSKEFPVGRVIDRLNSICKKIVDGAQTSTDTTQNLSDNNHNSESTNGTQMNHIIDENSNVVEENVYAATKIDALGLNSPLDAQKESNNHVSAMNVNRPLEEIIVFQRKSLATVVTDRDNEKQQVEPISNDADGVVKDMNESTCCINATPTADFRPTVLLSKLPPENWKESESVAPREDHPTKEAEQVVRLSDSTFMPHESDVEVMDLPGVQLQMDLLKSASSDAACIAKRTMNSLRNRYLKSSSLSVSQNCAGMSPNQGESGLINHLDGAKVGFTDVSGEPICTETNEMHLEVSGATGNHSQIAVKNILLHEGHRFDEKNVGSVASMMATSTGTPTKQVATIDKGMYEKISPRSCMKDIGGKLSCDLKRAAKKPSSVLVNVNQPQENGEPSLIDVNTMDLSSERVLVECSYNETNDLQIENSVKLMGCASDFVKSPPNMSINLEENIICSPHVGMTMSEPPKKQFSLRRSERLLKLKTSVEDSQRSLEHNKRNMNQIGSKSMSNGIHIGQSSTLSMNKGTTMTKGSHPNSMDSGSTANNYFPLCSKEFPVGRVIDRLNSICKKIVDGAQTSTDTTQNLSDNNHNSESTNGTQMNHIIDENSNAVEENVYAATKIDALGLNSPLDAQKESNNHVSAMNVNRPLEEITGFQRKSLATVVTDRDNEKQQVEPISNDADGVVKDMNESTCCINATPTADFRPTVLLSKLPPENWKESESVAPREDHPTKEAEHVIRLSDSTFMSHESDVEVMDLPGVQLQMDLLNSASSDAACIAKRTMNSLRNRYVKSSSLSVSQNCAGMSPNQGESGLINHLDGAKVGFTDVSGEPICTETNEMHLEVSGATGNHSQIAVKNILLHEGHRFDEKNVGSVASMMATSTGTPTKQVATIDKGMYEKISPRSCMKDVGGKLSCDLKRAAKEPSSVLVNVNQPQENGEPSLIDVNTMDLSSERVLVECSYNETNDLQIENSVKLMGCASDFVKSPPNMSINLEENIICSPHVGMTMSEPPKKQFSLRRSERLLKLKTSVEDSQRSLEHNKRNMNQIGSKSMSNGIHIGQSSTLSMNKGTTMTKGSHPKSAHVHGVVARKLNFSSHKSFHGCDVTSVEGILHTGLEGNNISSKKCNAEAIQENLQKSQAGYVGYSQNNSNHSRSKSQSVADPGKNQVLPSSDGHGFMNSGNVVRDSHDMTEDRIEADMQNLVMPTREQNISDVVINCVSGHAKETRRTDAHVDIQPNDDKSSGDAAKKSRQKPHFARQGVKIPLTRQRTKGLSFASPELLNYKRSRSGRLLVPTLANWCQQILYDMDGSVAGIVTGVDATKRDHRGSRSEPSRKRKVI